MRAIVVQMVTAMVLVGVPEAPVAAGQPRPWLLPQFKGRLPEPPADMAGMLTKVQQRFARIVTNEDATSEDVEFLAAALETLAFVPPDRSLLHDSALHIGSALMTTSLEDEQRRTLAQYTYVVMNSAILSGAELETLQRDVGGLLEHAGGEQQRVALVVRDIGTICDALREGRP